MDFQAIKKLKEWFLIHKRDLPWRNHPTPYRVWISEVMLQQTRAHVVIAYFQKWMKIFPTVQDLASSPLESVIKAWEGLGYYSRARNLHKASRLIVSEYGGRIPEDYDALRRLPGFGPYTTQAVLGFAFHKKAAPVDGNVLRVLSRYFRIKENIEAPKTKKKIQGLASQIIPETEGHIIAEALIELGALICQKRARCEKCPLRLTCKTFEYNEMEEIPVKKKKTPAIHLSRTIVIVLCQDHVLIHKVTENKIMADLWQFPYFEGIEGVEDLKEKISHQFSLEIRFLESLGEESQTFTKYKVDLFPVVFEAKRKQSCNGYQWIPLQELDKLPFCSGHRKLLHIKMWRSMMTSYDG